MKTLSLPCSIWIAATTLVALIAFAGPGDDDRQYAGQQARSIKALDDAEIDTLLNGRGMGLARAAELNHYPGPKHVLAHADELQLTPDQRLRTQQAFDRMHEDAVALGKKLVDAERELDALFAGGHADQAKLNELVARVATLQGEVRLAHLSAHLAMRDILTPQQIAAYDRLRGYTDPPTTNRTSK